MIKYLKTEEHGDLPIRISYSALKKFQEKTNKSLMDKGGLNDLMSGDLEHLLYFSLESGYRAAKRKNEFKFKFEEMEEILDDCMFDFIKLIPEFFPKEDDKKASDTKQQKK